MKQIYRSAILLMALLGSVTTITLSIPTPTIAETLFPFTPLPERVPVPSQISLEGKNVDNPVLAQATNGQLMVVFNQWVSDDSEDSDPYYSISNNNGQTWTPPTAIEILADKKSLIAITYDSNNVAHAVWSENQIGATQIFYANLQNGSSWSAPLELANNAIASQGVDIVASRPGVVDVIWDIDYGDTDGFVHHKRFTLSGNTWLEGTTLVVDSNFGIDPAITADVNGNLHAVWESQSDSQVYYSRLNVGANNWTSSPLQLSTGIVSGKSYSPDVAIYNNTIYVGISYRENAEQEGATNQAVFERHCVNATSVTTCLSQTNWSPVNNISGSFLIVRGNPENYYLSPNFATAAASQYRPTNLYAHYHGFTPGGETNEIVWRTDVCTNWAGSLPVQLTAFDTRAINPSAQVRASGVTVTVHTVYESISPVTTTDRAIKYVQSSSNCGQIYLPIIQK